MPFEMTEVRATLRFAAASPRADIDSKTRGEIEAYIAGRGKTSIHLGARNLSQNVSDDYGDRFLVELIQNAHDAHEPNRSDGEIAIVLNPSEGLHGCLYVANRGNGFTKANMEGIANIAQSSKPVNEGIGNKGLGFRSVLQICTKPEIYSASGSGSKAGFDGYCFRFATVEDIQGFLSENDDLGLADEIWANMPFWYLPVYTIDRPGLVDRFSAQGFATVVRMPLESAKALEVVRKQQDALRTHKRPLQLFLDRIASISIDSGSGTSPTELRRSVLEHWSEEAGLSVEKVLVGNERYLVTTYVIEHAVFCRSLELSLSRKEIPESWRDWRGAARVSIAVRFGMSVERGLLYCFLPMGEEAVAPFSGYLNANFYTKMDRSRVNDDIALNRSFLEVAALMCVHTIDFLIKRDWNESPGLVVDLLCWSGRHVQTMRNTLPIFGTGDMWSRKLLPTTGPKSARTWASADQTVIWDEPETACLSAKAVSDHCGANVLVGSLSRSQKMAVEEFFADTARSFAPKPELIAAWIERIASELLAARAEPLRWATLYDEAARHLRMQPHTLYGKKFLLSANGDLIASAPQEGGLKKRRTADVFFSPVLSVDDAADDADVKRALPLEKLPSSLKRGFALLSRDVPWTKDDGGPRPARSFLLEAKLAREYDTRDVLRTLARITQSDVVDRTKEQAIEWAYRLWSSGRSLSDKETRAAAFHVPTRGSWQSTESAMFGGGWGTIAPNGKRLEGFLSSAGQYSAELDGLRQNLLVAFKDWPVKYGDVGSWTEFLRAAGVRDCLRPFKAAQSVQRDGRPHDLPYQLANAVAGSLNASGIAAWQSALGQAAKKLQYPTVQYRVDVDLWRIPGQSSLDESPPEIGVDYAVQVVRSLPELSPEHLKARCYRPGKGSFGSNLGDWPTPLRIFLADCAWLPVARGLVGGARFVCPRDAWLFHTEDEVPPRFMELVLGPVAKLFDDPSVELLRSLGGLGVLTDERDKFQALTAYADAASLGLSDVRDVKRFRELFGGLWTRAAPSNDSISLAHIPVAIGTEIRAIATAQVDPLMDASVEPAYIVDEDSIAKKQLLEELAQPVFDFGAADTADTQGWLDVLAPGRFRLLSEEPLSVDVEGQKLGPLDSYPYLAEVFGEWIIDFIVCAAEHKGGAFYQATQKNLAKVRRVASLLRFTRGAQLQISMGGVVRDLPASLHGGVVVRDLAETLLIVQTDEDPPGIALLARVSEQLAFALQQRGLANALDAAFLRLSQRFRVGEDEQPTEDDLAEVLGTSIQKLNETKRIARADLSSQVRLAALLAACLGLSEVSEALARLAIEDAPAEDRVLADIAPISQLLGKSSQEILEQLGLVTGLKDLKDQFDLPIAELNAAAKAMRLEYRPISFEIQHRRQLKAYLTEQFDRLMDLLRTSFVDRFDRTESLSEYARIRDALPDISPDSNWFETFEDLPLDVLGAHVQAWLHAQGVSLPELPESLPTLKECRTANADRLRAFWGEMGPVLSAWVAQGGQGVTHAMRDVWTDFPATQRDCAARAYRLGWLDFRVLDHQAISDWLAFDGKWPVGKAVSAAYADWDLTEIQLNESSSNVEQERETQRKRRTQIKFAGQDYSALETDHATLIAAVRAGLSGISALTDINRSFKNLADVDPNKGSGGGSSRGSQSRGRRSHDAAMSDEQKKAIGLVGEIVARAWIGTFHLDRHQIEISDNCWVSRYRDEALGTDTGNDGLGYDFVVRLKSTTYYYEVKASSGDAQVFEMGPTEIAAAMRYRVDQDSKYRILYVADAMDPKRLSVTLLPNPFSRDGAKKLRAIGRGSVTYEFGLSPSRS